MLTNWNRWVRSSWKDPKLSGEDRRMYLLKRQHKFLTIQCLSSRRWTLCQFASSMVSRIGLPGPFIDFSNCAAKTVKQNSYCERWWNCRIWSSSRCWSTSSWCWICWCLLRRCEWWAFGCNRPSVHTAFANSNTYCWYTWRCSTLYCNWQTIAGFETFLIFTSLFLFIQSICVNNLWNFWLLRLTVILILTCDCISATKVLQNLTNAI